MRPYARRLLLTILLIGLLPFLLGARHLPALQPIRIIFLHHSCGHNLIEQGGVREGFTALGYEFYDHGYNDDGLRLADGSYSGTNFAVPDDNTDPDGIAYIFSQPLHDPPDNTFSYLMQYDVIAFKSCFPTSNIGDDEQLAEYKSYYLAIRDRMDQYPNKLFIIVTQPPQVPANSNPEEGARARALTVWLQSDEFLAGHPNVYVFDFFGLLAGDDNFLRPEYRSDEYDAHPNERANREIGPQFVAFFDAAIKSYWGDNPPPAATPIPTAPPEPTEPSAPPPEEAPGGTAMSGLLEGFESPETYWETDVGENSSVECGPDGGMAHSGASALRMQYTVAPDEWADCGRYFEDYQDWSAGRGLSLFLAQQGNGTALTVMLFSGDMEDPTPFVARVPLPTTTDWSPAVIPWDGFSKAEWAGEGGLTELDPTRMTGYGFSLESDGPAYEGVLWIDDLSLTTGAEIAPTAPPAVEEEPEEETTEPPSPEAVEEPEEPEEPEESGGGGGMCASAMFLPLAVLAVGGYRLRRTRSSSHPE